MDKTNKNWLAQSGQEITDADMVDAGLPLEMMYSDGLNRSMIDLVHAENVAGYIARGMTESEAKFKADERRGMALRAARANGLKL